MTPSTDPTARIAALALLGLPETATPQQIAHAYRRLVRATHPDATGRTDPAAARDFVAIHDAYQRLAHPVEDLVEPSRPQGIGKESAAPRERPRRPPTGTKAFLARAPIVAGPALVTALPEQRPTHQRRPR